MIDHLPRTTTALAKYSKNLYLAIQYNHSTT